MADLVAADAPETYDWSEVRENTVRRKLYEERAQELEAARRLRTRACPRCREPYDGDLACFNCGYVSEMTLSETKNQRLLLAVKHRLPAIEAAWRERQRQAERAALPQRVQSLYDATGGWAAPTFARAYPQTKAGIELLDFEVRVLGQHGYIATSQSADGGHVNVGTTSAIFALGGLAGLAVTGGSRSKGTIVVAFARRSLSDNVPPAGPAPGRPS